MQTTPEICNNYNTKFFNKLKDLSLPPNVRVGVLLLHGLARMPSEMRSVARSLKIIGCDVEVPTLSGHDGSRERLLITTWEDWVSGAKQSLFQLSLRCDRIYVGGISMGALIPMLLNADETKIDGIISISPTIKFDGVQSFSPWQSLLPLVDVFPPLGCLPYLTAEKTYGLKDQRLVRILKGAQERRGCTKCSISTACGYSDLHISWGQVRQLQHMVRNVKRTLLK